MYSGTVRVPDRRIGTNFGNLKSKVLDRFWSKWPEGPSFSGSIWLVLPPIRLTPLEKKNWPALMYCRNWGLLHCIAPILNLNWYQKCEVSATAWGYCLRCYSQLSASVLSVKKRKEQQIQVTPRTACLTWFWIFSHQLCDHFGTLLGPFWDHFGTILGPFWDHFGTILVQFWDYFRTFWDHFGTILGPFWDYFWTILGPF